VIDP
jgi:hypothetical protein